MHAPQFEQFAMEMKVFGALTVLSLAIVLKLSLENEPPHTMVGRVHAVDPEQPDTVPTYWLVTNDRQAKFSVDANGKRRCNKSTS